MRLQLSFTVEKMRIQQHKGSKYEYIMIILQNSDQLANTLPLPWSWKGETLTQ
ncbi:hypothetical protein DPMN_160473 [Dreissena polymorpha]|uniref:Uncharacterized protein n=1 Tax=Dreissena polymorpha TaxID=45954 RepID=A0A9D4INS9_DREPO|nr:hypothetical protein DPMN_160473 [Dreissena polymorpha]